MGFAACARLNPSYNPLLPPRPFFRYNLPAGPG